MGSPLGALKDLFIRVKAINDKHGSFAFVLCVGDFFGPTENDDINELLAGSLERTSCPRTAWPSAYSSLAPLPIYIIQGEHAFPPAVVEKLSSGQSEVVTNLIVLSARRAPRRAPVAHLRSGKAAVVTTPQNIRIGSCGGGKYDASKFKSTESHVRCNVSHSAVN